MLFALNWELRQAQMKTGLKDIPLEPPVTVGTEVMAEPAVVQRRAEEEVEIPPVPALVPQEAPLTTTPAGGE
jgi:hypothetical protein